MSLNYKLPSPHERFFGADGRMLPEVEGCILATLSTTVGCLKTEADAREHHARAALLARLAGCEPWFSVETALSLVGLSTNVFPRRTARAWGAKIVDGELKRIKHR